jgi:hypothetical protein
MNETKTEIVTLPRPNNVLKEVGGSNFEPVNDLRVAQVINTLWMAHSDDDAKSKQRVAAALSLAGIAPQDEVEGMLAAQMVACSNAAMECYRRAMIGEQTFDGRAQNLAFANKLSRTYAQQMDALQRYRGKGQQKMTVEHVHVHAGGQAIVGSVNPAGGVGVIEKTEDQSYAKQLEYQPDAPLPEMPCPNATGQAVPIASDAKRKMPDARRQSRSAQRKPKRL